jgi:glycosyltransferase involved in cell wall biosynthesis
VASYTANLARALADAGARVLVIADRGPGQPRASEERGVMVQRPFTRGPWALPRARAAALRAGARIVHLQHEHFLYGGASAQPGLLAALARFPTPLVVTMHQVVDPDEVDGAFTERHCVRVPVVVAKAALTAVQSSIACAADAVVVHEPQFASVVPGSEVIPHGVEVLQPADPAAVRPALGLHDELAVLCFGYLAPYKGLEVAVAAAPHAGPAVRLVIAGGEHPRIGRRDWYASALRAAAPANVQFTGYVPEPSVSLWFSAADVVLLPHEAPFSSSGSLALALGYRAPVLLSAELANCAGAPAAMAFERDPETLGARLQRLALDAHKRVRLREATEQFARGRSWPEIARRHLDLYEEVIRGKGTVGRSLRAAQSG